MPSSSENGQISKLPMRQLTQAGGHIIVWFVSKLPMRQLTRPPMLAIGTRISKLPMRQLTERNTERR